MYVYAYIWWWKISSILMKNTIIIRSRVRLSKWCNNFGTGCAKNIYENAYLDEDWVSNVTILLCYRVFGELLFECKLKCVHNSLVVVCLWWFSDYFQSLTKG